MHAVKSTLFYIILGLFYIQSTLIGQNAIVGPAFSTGWGGGSCPTGSSNFNYFSPGFGSSFIGTFTANGTGTQYFRFGIDWSGTTAQRTINIGSDVTVSPETPYVLNSSCTTSGALKYNVPNASYKYVFKTKDAGATPAGNIIFFEIQGDVRTIS